VTRARTVNGHRIPPEVYNDFVKKHWGEHPDFIYEHPDPRLPAKYLPEMGKLQEILIDVLDDRGKRIGDLHLDFPDDDRCILAYDKDTHRLYCGFPSEVYPRLAKRLWVDGQPDYPLHAYAQALGKGRHTQPGCPRYPKVRVQGLGPVRHVIYYTHKRGHGPSRYKHELGENSGIRPDLCVSKDGALWWAGGNYTVRKHGIID
jgi:hypothetical protein